MIGGPNSTVIVLNRKKARDAGERSDKETNKQGLEFGNQETWASGMWL